MVVEKMLALAQNLSVLWASSDFVEKQNLQYLVYPEGILYSSKSRAVRTDKFNALFACIPPQAHDSTKKKKGDSVKNRPFPDPVPEIGIEPIHPCEWQILSLLRLPIPPPGQVLNGRQYYNFWSN
ncbi:MAG: recombinase family protein [Flaviaesturariibacter sp.]|nr:recombinase family protein [Flaviaesturariibacter sp.]